MTFKYFQLVSIFSLYVNIVYATEVTQDKVNVLHNILSNQGWWQFDRCIASVDGKYINASDLYIVGSNRSINVNQENYFTAVNQMTSILNCVFSEVITEIAVWFSFLVNLGYELSKNAIFYPATVDRLVKLMPSIQMVLTKMQKAMAVMRHYGASSSCPSETHLQSFSKYLDNFNTLHEISLRNMEPEILGFGASSHNDMTNHCVPSSNPRTYEKDFLNAVTKNSESHDVHTQLSKQDIFEKTCGTFESLLDTRLYESYVSRGFNDIELTVHPSTPGVVHTVPVTQPTAIHAQTFSPAAVPFSPGPTGLGGPMLSPGPTGLGGPMLSPGPTGLGTPMLSPGPTGLGGPMLPPGALVLVAPMLSPETIGLGAPMSSPGTPGYGAPMPSQGPPGFKPAPVFRGPAVPQTSRQATIGGSSSIWSPRPN